MPDAYAAQLFADVAGTGASSRLFQALREEQGLAYTVFRGSQTFSDCGLFWVYRATARPLMGGRGGAIARSSPIAAGLDRSASSTAPARRPRRG